jgi:hypothetical protein
MGSAVNASTLGMAIAGLCVAIFSRKIDRRLGILISLAVLAIPTALLASAPNLAVFTLLRVAQGLCMASAFTLTLAYLGEHPSAVDSATASAAYITGNVASNLFGLDSGAQIGLEYRFGIVRNVEVGLHRTSDKTIEFFSQYGVVRQTSSRPVDVSVLVSVEGTNNFRDQYSPAVGAIVSRTFGERAALYVEPVWVHHANVQPDTAITGAPTDTVMVGLGGRFRVRPTVSIVAEFSPRLSGFRPGVNHGGLAIEKRAGGHMFQLNVSDSFATTMGQIARGGPAGTN